MDWGPDPRFAGVIGLGAFRKLYPRANLYRLLAVLLGGLMLAPLAFRVISREPFTAGGSADALFSLIGAPLVFWLMWRRRGDAAALYDGGIACYGHDGPVEIKWEEICDLHKNFVAIPPGNDNDWAAPQYCLETIRGGKLELSGLVDIEELWAVIQKNVPSRMLAALIAEIEAGQALPFGPFWVSARGLDLTEGRRGRRIEWARIRSVEEEPGLGPSQWKIIVRVEGEHPWRTERWARVPRYRVSNASIFIALCEHFITEHRPT